MRDTEPPEVVFLPGFMQPGNAWAPVAERVAERYPSVCLDFDTWTLEERVGEIARACPPGSVGVGYSMGGRLALHAAVDGAPSFGALVVVGAAAGIDDPPRRRERRVADEELARWIERRPIEEVVERWERQPVLAGQRPELVAGQRPGRLAHEPALLARLLRSAGQGAVEPFWQRLSAIGVPVLALAGARDPAYARAAERMARLLPRGRAELIGGAGHAPQLERPAAVAALLLEFLDEHFG